MKKDSKYNCNIVRLSRHIKKNLTLYIARIKESQTIDTKTGRIYSNTDLKYQNMRRIKMANYTHLNDTTNDIIAFSRIWLYRLLHLLIIALSFENKVTLYRFSFFRKFPKSLEIRFIAEGKMFLLLAKQNVIVIFSV